MTQARGSQERDLTKREKETLGLLADGLGLTAISQSQGIGLGVVKQRVANIMLKLRLPAGTRNEQIVEKARELGLIE